MSELWDVFRDGLWRRNAALVSALGVGPLLAVSDTALKGTAMGLVMTATLAASAAAASLTRHLLPIEVRLPAQALMLATVVSVLEQLTRAHLYALAGAFGLYLPVLAGNALVLSRAEAFAGRRPLALALADALGLGVGLTLAGGVLGATRELLGSGTLLGDAWLVLEGAGEPVAGGASVAGGPAGAFLALGLLIALCNALPGGERAGRGDPAA